MREQTTIKALDPYERKTLNLLKQRGKLKFAEIIMRLGLTVSHGKRVLDSLNKKGFVVFQSESNKFRLHQETE